MVRACLEPEPDQLGLQRLASCTRDRQEAVLWHETATGLGHLEAGPGSGVGSLTPPLCRGQLLHLAFCLRAVCPQARETEEFL